MPLAFAVVAGLLSAATCPTTRSCPSDGVAVKMPQAKAAARPARKCCADMLSPSNRCFGKYYLVESKLCASPRRRGSNNPQQPLAGRPGEGSPELFVAGDEARLDLLPGFGGTVLEAAVPFGKIAPLPAQGALRRARLAPRRLVHL